MSAPLGTASSVSILRYCLICGIENCLTKRRCFHLIGKEAKIDRHRSTAVWMKEYIGVGVDEAMLCHSCYKRVETLDVNMKRLREMCSKTLESLGFSSVPEKNVTDHSYSAKLTGAKLNITIPESAIISPPTETNDAADDDDIDNNDNEFTSYDEGMSLLCTFCDEVFTDQMKLDAHIKSHDAHTIPQGTEKITPSVKVEPQTAGPSVPVMLFKHVPNHSGPVTRGKSGAQTRQNPFILPKSRSHTEPLVVAAPSVKQHLIRPRPGPSNILRNVLKSTDDASSPATELSASKKKSSSKRSPKIYKCKICNAEFKSSLYCSRHQDTHDKYYTEKITVDEAKSSEKDSDTEKPEDTLEPFQCKICGVEFHSQNEAVQHMKSHTEKTPYMCKICDKRLATKSSMRIHLLSHAADKAFSCEECSKKFATRGAYNRHIKTHTNKSHLCQQCGKLFATKDTLKQHTDSIHNDGYVKSHICEVCGKGFDRVSKLSVHKSSHTKDRYHLCDICGKTFKHAGVLKTHKKLNCAAKIERELHKKSGDETGKAKRLRAPKTPRPHKCTACPYRFKTVGKLADHVTLTHERECILCGVAIYSGKALKAHKAVCKLGELSKEEEESEQVDNDEDTDASPSTQPTPAMEDNVINTPSTSGNLELIEDTSNMSTKAAPVGESSATVITEHGAFGAASEPDETSFPMDQSADVTNTAVEAFLTSLTKRESSTDTATNAVILPVSESQLVPSVSEMDTISMADLSGTNPVSISAPEPMLIDPELVGSYPTTTAVGAPVGMEGETIVLVLEDGTDPSQATVAFSDNVTDTGNVYQTIPVASTTSTTYYSISKSLLQQ